MGLAPATVTKFRLSCRVRGATIRGAGPVAGSLGLTLLAISRQD